MRTLLLSNVKPIDALNITPLFEDNGSVAKGIEDTLKENREYELALKNSNLVQNIEVQENEQGEQNETEE